jgi:hypothetical protein
MFSMNYISLFFLDLLQTEDTIIVKNIYIISPLFRKKNKIKHVIYMVLLLITNINSLKLCIKPFMHENYCFHDD